MHTVTVIIALSLPIKGFYGEPVRNPNDDEAVSKSKVVRQLVGERASKVLNGLRPNPAAFDYTTAGKAGHVAISRSAVHNPSFQHCLIGSGPSRGHSTQGWQRQTAAIGALSADVRTRCDAVRRGRLQSQRRMLPVGIQALKPDEGQEPEIHDAKMEEAEAEEERQKMREALALDPSGNALAWSNFGVLGGGQLFGRTYREKDCFEQALSLEPSVSGLWCNLGGEGGGMIAGQMFSDTQCYEKALHLDPEDAAAWSNLAFLGGGQHDGQKYSENACYEKAVSLDPQEAAAWSNLAAVGGGLFNNRQYSEIECYAKAAALDPSDAVAWSNLGAAGGGEVSGRKYSTVECCEKALCLEPQDAAAWSNLGREGGGVVDGRRYSQTECLDQANRLLADLLIPYEDLENQLDEDTK